MSDYLTEGEELQAFLCPGAVFYFINENLNSDEPHYHFVLNYNPFDEPLLILVLASSQIQSVKARRAMHPIETLVEMDGNDYNELTKPSIVDCNFVEDRLSKVDLQRKYSQNVLKAKAPISSELLEKLRDAVGCSRMVKGGIKKELKR